MSLQGVGLSGGFFDKLRMSGGNTERYILRQAQNERGKY